MKKSFDFKLSLIAMGLFNMCLVAHAKAPVIDHSQFAASSTPTHISYEKRNVSDSLEVDQGDVIKPGVANETIEQRITKLEKQLSNITEMNLTAKIDKAQQELQQLRGQIEVQSHDLAQLKEQQKHFYADLDQRLNKVTPIVSTQEEEPVSADNKITAKNNAISSDTSEKELQAYEDAFNLLNKKQYEKAVGAFQTFIKNYPESLYAVNAHYWLGEIFYLKAKPVDANNEFELIVAKYPKNQKVPDALLKMAIIAMDNSKYQEANNYLQKIQKQFPNTSQAKVATLRLKELKSKSKC